MAQETKTAELTAKDDEIGKLELTVVTLEGQMDKLNEDHLALVSFSFLPVVHSINTRANCS